MPIWPSSSVTTRAVSWSINWLRVTITPLFIKVLINSPDLIDKSFARSETEMVSGILISFWMNSAGFSNSWTLESFVSKYFSPSSSLLSFFESCFSLNWILVFTKGFFWTFTSEVDGFFILFTVWFCFSSLACSTFFSASFLFASAASKSISPLKSAFVVGFVSDKFWFNLVIDIPFFADEVSFFKEIVFFDVFFEDFKKVKRVFLSSLLTSSVIDLWDKPAADICLRRFSGSKPIAFDNCVTFTFFF